MADDDLIVVVSGMASQTGHPSMENAVGLDVTDSRATLELFTRLALEAGRAIMDVYHTPMKVDSKDDASPVTEADRRAEAIILAGLRTACPALTCVAEEEMAEGHGRRVGPAETFVLVDPLDGTREFIGANPDFTVNIALVRGGVPVLGVVYAPARGVLYSGGPDEAMACDVDTAFRCAAPHAIVVRRVPDVPTIVASRSHRTPETDAFIARYPGARTVSVGSSLKFCLLASGAADLYPRFGRTMEWDTAAGDAVLRAAGGSTMTPHGAALVYGKRNQADADYANSWFVATAGMPIERDGA